MLLKIGLRFSIMPYLKWLDCGILFEKHFVFSF